MSLYVRLSGPREFVGDPCSKDSRSRWYTAEEARSERFDTLDLAENGVSTTSCVYQIGLPDNPV